MRLYPTILLVCLALSLKASEVNFYCSTTNGIAGDGSLGNPYSSLASLPWAVISAQLNSGNRVNINLQRGSVFRSNLTLGAGGLPGARLVFQAYGDPQVSGNPLIAGDDTLTGFSLMPGSVGSTWGRAVSSLVTMAFGDGLRLTQGVSVSGLRDREWFWTGGTFYLRWDAGQPDSLGVLIEVTTRNSGISSSGFSHIDFMNIDVRRVSNRALYFSNGMDITFSASQLSQSGILLELSSIVNFDCRTTRLVEAYDSNNAIKVSGAASMFSFKYCLFHDFKFGPAVNLFGGQAGNFVNCTFVGCRTYHLYCAATNGTFWAANSIFSGVAAATIAGGRESVKCVAGTLSLSNCLVMASGKDPRLRLSGVSEYGTVWGEPQYRYTRYPAIMAFGRDDSEVIDDALALSTLLKTYGWGVTYAFTSGGAGAVVIDGAVTNKLRQIVANGSEVTCHARDHIDLTDSRAFRIQYLGAATNATLSIAGSNLTLKLNGELDRVLDLTAPDYATLERLVAAINSMGYSCVWPQVAARIPYTVPSQLLTNVIEQDIKSSAFVAYLDYQAYLNYEMAYSKAELQSMIGNGYVVTGLTYPYGAYNSVVISNAVGAGYSHGRTVTYEPTPGYLLSSNNPMLLAVAPDLSGTVSSLGLENSAGDSSAAGNHFTSSGVTYSMTTKFRGQYSGQFNGTSAYLSRAANASFDFSWGDWLFCGRLRPAQIGSSQVLFFTGSSETNYLRIGIDPQGAIRIDAATNGSVVVSFSSGSTTLTNGGWQKVSLQQTYDNWYLRVNDVLVAATNSPGRLQAFGGIIYIGCAYDFNALAPAGYYAGYMDDINIANKTYTYTQSMLDQICEEGCFVEMYGHTEGTSPQEIWRVMFDAVRDYSGRVSVMNEGAAANYIRTNGQLSTIDGQTVLRTNTWVSAGDYSLRPTSPARDRALLDPLVGQTNLVDLGGVPITGSQGELLVASASVGAFEYRPPSQPLGLQAIANTNGSLQLTFNTVPGGIYDLESQTALQDQGWVLRQRLVGNGQLARFYESTQTSSQRFYRVIPR